MLETQQFSIDETLLCELENTDGSQSNAILSASLNPENGSLQWSSKSDLFIYLIPDVQDPQKVMYSAIAKSQMSGMLKDTHRNERYYSAIKKAIKVS